MKAFNFKLLMLLFAAVSVFTACSDDDNNDTPVNPNPSYALDPQIESVEHKHALKQLLDDAFNMQFEQIVFSYTSVGPDMKTPIRLTGVISMSTDVYNSKVQPTTLMLYNEFTTAKHRERTSQDEIDDVGLFLNKYQSRIVISADLYGWTLTEDKPQAYCCTPLTCQETIDCWDAAMMILKKKGYKYEGLPCYNVGYSSGALSAMAFQRYVNANRPDIKFEVTSVGGGPHDLAGIYREYVETNYTGYVCALPLLVVAYNETYNLGFDYKEVFQEPLRDKIQEWILSKDYNTWEINALIGIGKPVDEILTPLACDTTSRIGSVLMQKFHENSVVGGNNDWKPSTDTEYLIFHSSKDSYMSTKCSIDLANFLKSKGCNVTTDFGDRGDHVSNGLYYWMLETLLMTDPTTHPLSSRAAAKDYSKMSLQELVTAYKNLDTK